MPALYALAQHAALREAAAQLTPADWLFAFLYDLYVITTRSRAAEVFQIVAQAVETRAGVRTHLGKLHAWSKGGG
eukprot:1010344-Karenia_brevis.AAC.1